LDIEERLKKAAVFYQAVFNTSAQALQMQDTRHIRPGQSVTLTTFIQLNNFCDQLLYKDVLPTGWPKPQELRLTLDGPHGQEVRTVSPEQLQEGLMFAVNGRPGEHLTLSYTLQAPHDFAYAENPFSPDLRPYAVKEAPVIVVQGTDVVTGEWHQAPAKVQGQNLRTPSRLAAGDFPRIVHYLYGGQIKTEKDSG
jgi:hypothetical protein